MRTRSYASRLRYKHQTSDGECGGYLAGHILVAPRPMQCRLLPFTQEPQACPSSELAGVHIVYVLGLIHMPFREMRGYLHDFSPSHLAVYLALLTWTVSHPLFASMIHGHNVNRHPHGHRGDVPTVASARGCPCTAINKMMYLQYNRRKTPLTTASPGR